MTLSRAGAVLAGLLLAVVGLAGPAQAGIIVHGATFPPGPTATGVTTNDAYPPGPTVTGVTTHDAPAPSVIGPEI
ncbi:hypothetical protein ABT369_50470 [Dactylosporangium sp. NPDC000244]|uniref:hypothetical protein n=1 Tax=Dactylosporangium sp. NPDC000244 TaxID=3154365 RepID=UPI003324A2FD